MNKKYLILLALPLLLSGCSKNNDDADKKYPVVPAQMVAGLYRQHSANLSYLTEYQYTMKYDSNPQYTVLGENASEYVEDNVSTTVSVYSGVFVASTRTSNYVGNKADAGTKTTSTSTDYYWFESFDESATNKRLVKRTEITDKDQQKVSNDEKLNVYMDESKVPSYFSGAINESTYIPYFTYRISPLIGSTSIQKDAETIISTTYSLYPNPTPIQNPDYPDDSEMSLVAFDEVKTTTIFRLISGIGWVGTNFSLNESRFVVTDNRLRLSSDRVYISSRSIDVSYTYSKSLMIYTGVLQYKERDSKLDEYKPIMYSLGEDGSSTTPINKSFEDITTVYRALNPSYEGYAYKISDMHLTTNHKYSFATSKDNKAGQYETIGYNQLISNASGFIVSGGLAGHNSIKAIDVSYAYEFLILVDSEGVGSLIARFSSSI